MGGGGENVFKKKKAARKSQRQFTGGVLNIAILGLEGPARRLPRRGAGRLRVLPTRFRPEWNPEILGGLVELGGGKLGGEVGGDVGGEREVGGGRRRKGKLEEREKFLSSPLSL